MINKDTKIYCSFAEQAGNTGCIRFNSAFEHYGLNAIYKSFSVKSIKDAVCAARTLNFSGFAVTMPFKKEVLDCVDRLSQEVREIGAANTVVNEQGVLKAYNTDYIAAKTMLKGVNMVNVPSLLTGNTRKELVILGNGGYADAVRYAADLLRIGHITITRERWSTISGIRDSIVYNCTPVPNIEVDKTNRYIDCLVSTKTGKELSEIQARHQFLLYTGLDLPTNDEKNAIC